MNKLLELFCSADLKKNVQNYKLKQMSRTHDPGNNGVSRITVIVRKDIDGDYGKLGCAKYGISNESYKILKLLKVIKYTKLFYLSGEVSQVLGMKLNSSVVAQGTTVKLQL